MVMLAVDAVHDEIFQSKMRRTLQRLGGRRQAPRYFCAHNGVIGAFLACLSQEKKENKRILEEFHKSCLFSSCILFRG